MKSLNKKQQTAKDPAAPTTRDNMRWIMGFIVLFFGLFVVASTLFSLVYWREDQSLFNPSTIQTEIQTAQEALSDAAENPCGRFGAFLGWLLVDCSFGVFGVMIPVIIAWIGLKLIRQRDLEFNRSMLPLVLVMIFGSLTLGFLVPSVDWVSAEGPGGAFGKLLAAQLSGYVGTVGMVLLLLSGWILLGVLINRNFINTVNRAGNRMVDGSERFVEAVKNRVATAKEETAEEERQRAADAAREAEEARLREEARLAAEREDREREERAREQAEAEEYLAREEAERLEAEREVALEVEKPQPEYAEEPAENAAQTEPAPMPDEGFTLEEGTTAPTANDTAPRRRSTLPVTPADDDRFTLVDVQPQPRTQVVMGRGGLIELAPVSPRTQAEPLPEQPRLGAEIAAELHAEETEQQEQTIAIEQSAQQEQQADAQLVASSQLEIEKPAADGGVVVDVEEHHDAVAAEDVLAQENYDPLKDLVNYRKPSVNLLEDYQSATEVTNEEIFENKSRIEETLKNFGIPIQKIKATVGPTVTLYEIVQAQGVKISKIQGLENDIAQSLKALGIRIIAPIPGKGTIGIEVPNRDKEVVSMYSCVRSVRFQESKAQLPVVIGRTIQNENYVFDLAKMPHLLVAGATGQGKSVGLNAIITSLLYRKHPAQLKFVLIDPKMVEFSLYAKIERHFLAKMESEDEAVVTDPQKAVYTLNALCVEMDNRLELCKKAGTRNIAEYNEKFVARRLNPQHGHRYLPYIVVVVDEFADLIMTAKEVEGPVMRLAQKARAIGIHLIIATQRPDVKVITGGIKANFPARMAFRVMQMIDSRTIIDQPGANQLIGRGDMLFSKDGELTRIQCALVETKDVERIVDYIATQQAYTEPYPLPDYTPDTGDGGAMGSDDQPAVRYDSLFAQIARDVVTGGQISTSMIQRNYEVGFNRAGRIMLQLERAGIVGKQHGAKPRDILFHDLPSLEAKLQDLGVF